VKYAAYLCSMFLKKVIKENKSDKQYVYYRLCESVRIGTKTRHHILLNLGSLLAFEEVERKMLANRIEELYQGHQTIFHHTPDKIEQLARKFYTELRDKNKQPVTSKNTTKASVSDKKNSKPIVDIQKVDINSMQHDVVREIGAEHLCLQTLEELKLPTFLEGLNWSKEKVNTALTHIISRAVYPASEHKTAQWIASSSSIKELLFKEDKNISYQQLYKLSKELYSEKERIEKHLSTKTNELFDLQDKIILFDLTNTYFEGRKQKSEIAQFGRSKEKRSDAKLVSLALVVNAEGFVKYSKIYNGNISEPKTLADIVAELSQNTSNNSKPTIVIDAGIATEENLAYLKNNGYHYLCVTRRKLKDYKPAFESEKSITITDKRGNKIELQKVVKKDVKNKEDNKTELIENAKEHPTDQFMYIRSEMKAVKEASMNTHFSTRYEEALNQLDKSIQSKRGVKNIAKVHERLGRIKERYPSANKHYEIVIKEGEDNKKNKIAKGLTFKRKEIKITSAEGVYFIRTSLQDKDEKTIWDIYNAITEVETAFRTLKTDLSLRPVFHQKDGSTMAHIHLGILAYSLVNTIRYKLKQKGISHDWKNIVRIMNTQKLVTTSIKKENGQIIIIKKCSQPNDEVTAIYHALNYKQTPLAMKNFVLPH